MVALKAELDSFQLRRMAAAIERAPDIVLEELTKFVSTVTPHIYSEVFERTPTSGAGLLRNSLSYQVRPVGRLGVEGIVGTSSPYATPVEEGTRPHPVSRDGREALADWARRKLGVSERESHRVAFLVARKIGRLGTEGAFMFKHAFEASQDDIARGLDRCLDLIEERISQEMK